MKHDDYLTGVAVLVKITVQLSTLPESRTYSVFGTDRGDLSIKGLIKDITIEKDESIQGLALCGGSNIAFGRQV